MNGPQNSARNQAGQRRRWWGRRLVFGFFLFIAVVMVIESPLTRVRTMQVQGNRSIPEAAILNSSGLKAGMSVWQVNAAAVQKSVETAHPLVQSVQVQTSYVTGLVTLSIREKQIVALLESTGKFYQLLNDGTVYAVAATSGVQWPIVTAGAPLTVRVGAATANANVNTVCGQLARVPDTEKTAISEIHLDAFGEVTVYLNNGFAALTKPEQLVTTMDSVGGVVQYFLAKGYAPGVVDMTGGQPYRYTPFSQAPAKENRR